MQKENAQKLVSIIEGFINPFSYQGKYIINQVTKAVLPDKIKQGICLIEEVGVATRETFIQERIKTEHVNIWAPMQNVQLQTWSTSINNVHVAISNKVLKLKGEGWLFAGVATNCRPDMHLQECFSNFELSIVPRSLFAADGTMLHCSAKSK